MEHVTRGLDKDSKKVMQRIQKNKKSKVESQP
jgi:hypothetical protein